jgi:hypothetical protein
MRLHRTIGPQKNRFFPFSETRTDAEGRYRMAGLGADDRYYFEIVDPDGMAAPDWQHQSPYMQTVPKGQSEVRLPDVLLVTHGQSLRGVVIDPRGKPVAGLDVSARLAAGGLIPRPVSGPPPWTKTDEQGRFELRQLPDEPIELMAYRGNPKGGQIRYPSVVRPTKNQRTIRIIFDPTLDESLEDLDAPKKTQPRKP